MILINEKVKFLVIFFLCTKSLFSMRNPFFLPKKEMTLMIKKNELEDVIFLGMGKNNKKTCAFIKIDKESRIVFLKDNIFDFQIKDINKEYITLSKNENETKIFIKK